MQIKMFTGNKIEKEVNNWLSTFTGTVIAMTQSSTYGKTTITILFDNNGENNNEGGTWIFP